MDLCGGEIEHTNIFILYFDILYFTQLSAFSRMIYRDIWSMFNKTFHNMILLTILSHVFLESNFEKSNNPDIFTV